MDNPRARQNYFVIWTFVIRALIRISNFVIRISPPHMPTITNIQAWIATGGYVVLFGLLFSCGLGLPLPEDVPLIAAGALVANGKMSLLIAAIVGWCGIIGGDCMLYMMGKKFGLEITRVPFVGKHLTEARIRRVQGLFEKYGTGVVFIGRMFAGVRGAMVVAAGAIRFNFATFIVADGLGAVVSGGFFLFVGHWLGKNLSEEKIKRFKLFFTGGGLVVALVFAGWILWSRRHRPPTTPPQPCHPPNRRRHRFER
jgi:membrane protein DedA with SNARE-associated domain